MLVGVVVEVMCCLSEDVGERVEDRGGGSAGDL